jgi:hypothetical protein
MIHHQVKCRGDGSEGEDETASFSPVVIRRLRRDVRSLAAGSVMATIAGLVAVGSYGANEQLGGMAAAMAFVFAFVWSWSAGASIMTRFWDERDKARADRRTLIELVSARGRGAAGSADGRERGYPLPSATVHRINPKGGRRFQ